MNKNHRQHPHRSEPRDDGKDWSEVSVFQSDFVLISLSSVTEEGQKKRRTTSPTLGI